MLLPRKNKFLLKHATRGVDPRVGALHRLYHRSVFNALYRIYSFANCILVVTRGIRRGLHNGLRKGQQDVYHHRKYIEFRDRYSKGE